MRIVYLFWTDQCHRCRMFKPVFDAWAQKYSGADFVRVPLEDAWIARKLNISTVPTVVVVDEANADPILGWFSRRLPTEEEMARLLQEPSSPQTGPNEAGKEEQT